MGRFSCSGVRMKFHNCNHKVYGYRLFCVVCAVCMAVWSPITLKYVRICADEEAIVLYDIIVLYFLWKRPCESFLQSVWFNTPVQIKYAMTENQQRNLALFVSERTFSDWRGLRTNGTTSGCHHSSRQGFVVPKMMLVFRCHSTRNVLKIVIFDMHVKTNPISQRIVFTMHCNQLMLVEICWQQI